MPRTTKAFVDFLRRYAMQTEQLFLLGDLFEYWAGDDDLATPFHQHVIKAIQAVSAAGVAVFWIAGNRDFLLGAEFARATGAARLPDPYVATIGERRVVLTHGDEQCTDDAAYMEFRARVRQADWQAEFLATPLDQRKAVIQGMRRQSREAQRTKPDDIMDVNPQAIESLFDSSGAGLMIHGHTHRPARHSYRNGATERVRFVLPDWDCDAAPARGGWLEIRRDGSVNRVDLDGNVIA